MPKYYEFKVAGYYLYFTSYCVIECMHVHASDRKLTETGSAKFFVRDNGDTVIQNRGILNDREIGRIRAFIKQNYQEMYLTLQKAMNWVPNQVQPSNGMDRLTFLQSKLQEYQTDYDEIGINIDNAKRFIGESTGYSSEAEHQ